MLGDADLFISVMDGRYPTEADHDYSSTMQGTDYVRIQASDFLF